MKKKLAALIALLLLGTGCATIMHGTSQDVGISSTPTGAKVTVGGVQQGTTPVIAKLSRKDNNIVKIDLPGYQPFEATVTKKVSGWVWGNILFGGIVGLAVDAISGGLYNLTPEQIAGQLARQSANGFSKQDGTTYVFVVLHPDPTWQRVGSLTPVGTEATH